jgi:hypothetical protein
MLTHTRMRTLVSQLYIPPTPAPVQGAHTCDSRVSEDRLGARGGHGQELPRGVGYRVPAEGGFSGKGVGTGAGGTTLGIGLQEDKCWGWQQHPQSRL